MKSLSPYFLAAILAAPLCGCSAISRIDEIGRPPSMAPIPTAAQPRNYTPVSLPMPAQEPQRSQANSLWRPGARAFLKDQRASRVGDILTVQIKIADNAKLADTTKRTRSNSEKAGATNFLGLESKLATVLPNAVDPTSLVDLGSDGSSAGTGSVDRSEDINTTIAAVVTQVLPNGNLVIYGKQEVRVNFEVRELTVQGVVRPEDISATNTIQHTQIAEARISYGGRGQLTDVQQPRYGQQLFDILAPW
jgi:flagellar L-ring protein precursor FlgH